MNMNNIGMVQLHEDMKLHAQLTQNDVWAIRRIAVIIDLVEGKGIHVFRLDGNFPTLNINKKQCKCHHLKC